MAATAPFPSSASSDALSAEGNGFPPPSSSATNVPDAPPTPEPAPAEPTPTPAPAVGKARRGFWKRGARAEPEADPAVAPKPRRRRRKVHFAAPSWGVSFVMHVGILGTLAAVSFSTEPIRKALHIDSALVGNPGGADELVHIYAEPNNQPRDSAVGGGSAGGGGGGGGGGGAGTFGGIGTGPPSATPAVNGGGGGINEKNGLPGVKVVGLSSGLGLATLAAPGMDLGSGGMIAGDVTYGTKDIGEALDQLAREILRHLSQHKLTVVWLFDESESMKDDQKTIYQKFDRVSTELKINADSAAKKKTGAPLNHVIVGFGKDIHYEIKKPTADIDVIGRAIQKLKVDDTGVENTMHAVADVINNYAGVINKDRKLLIVLVTDESGDDGGYVEEAHQAAMSRGVPIYVIGRQSLFGYHRVRIRYIDPVTKDEFWPEIRRGPETADLEVLQWDGLRDRQDEQPSGFAPYELARLAKDTGGIYFLLPSEESLRLITREKAYSITAMKELVPDYASRGEYLKRRNDSPLRQGMYDVITMTKGYSFPLGYSINLDEMVPAATDGIGAATARLNGLIKIQEGLEGLKKLRAREPDKRWQANYDLLLAQVVAYQIKAYEYRACLQEMIKQKPKPKTMPTPTLNVWWALGHSGTPKAPKEETGKKYAEAEKLFKNVIERYPNTPWADLAQDEINRGFSVGWGEAHHSPSPTRAAREKFVPKF